MSKLPFMKWYPADWLNDTRSLSAEAKGCWIDILCLMWNGPKRGIWSGSFQEFARVTGTPWENAPVLITELEKVSRVTRGDNSVTLQNRRMRKQETGYKSHADRQAAYRMRHKSDAVVTPKTLDVRCQTSDVRDVKDLKTPPITTPPQGGKSLLLEFEKVWARYPKRRGKKAAERHFRASVHTPEELEAIHRALDAYLADLKANGTEIQFTQNGSTWFNDWQSWQGIQPKASARAVQQPRETIPTAIPSWKIIPKPEDLVSPQDVQKLVQSLSKSKSIPPSNGAL